MVRRKTKEKRKGGKNKKEKSDKGGKDGCAAYIGIGGMKIEDEPRH